MQNELLYQLALTMVPQVGPIHARLLIEHFGKASSIFKAPIAHLEKIEGIGTIRAHRIKSFNNFTPVEAEMVFMQKYNILPLFITDPDYPKRLLNCYDPPTPLYYRGDAPLNSHRMVAIIGTRRDTEYGKQLTEKIVQALAKHDVIIVSGLAFGIDAVAHKAALKNNIATIGVLAHGLDTIYPQQHAGLAKEMIKQQGGLITEFRSDTKPDKHHFPTRNRIVAGMCDAVIVVESGIKGGSMVTAELANGYNKDVFACPGRTIDAKSAGCNHLIKTNKAILLSDAEDIISLMGWQPSSAKSIKQQRELFVHLTDDEKIIVDQLKTRDRASIDELNNNCGISSSRVAAAILNLELQNLVYTLPGKIYSLC